MHTCLFLLGVLGALARREFLTYDNFTLSLQPDSKDWLIFYTHPEAGLSELEYSFLNASEHEKTPKVNYILMNCAEQADICQKQNVASYPTIKHHWNQIIKDYEWDLTEQDFFEFGYKLSLPPVLQLQRREVFDRFKKIYDLSFMLWFYPNEFEDSWRHTAAIYDKIALEYRSSHIRFGRAARVEFRDEEGIDIGDLPCVKQYGLDEAYEYSVKHFTEDSLREFVELYKYSMLTPLTKSIWKEFSRDTKDKVAVITFIDMNESEQVVKYYNNLKAISWDLRTNKDFKYQLAYVDTTTEKGLPDLLGVKTFPSLIAIHKGVVYSLDISLDSTVEFLSQMQEVLDGSYKEKMAEVPAKGPKVRVIKTEL
mmetsp:Transcript_13233/g.24792  ORF Transcript_13233/g.24792 Transcript_13233/m.24792 type:complete len:367 (-) Transcript_13233:1992-3092(-)|eukprot:CAMPEP_0204898822 /NCGR_PEP_ID=MMETSP1397-20131031/1505_1 /ASSEMBLY_ACC=CAM_ASM_000891 /TAXON_ID=49980 /ORGANISM="Climacostomum Climacostomum virens, Strain Stock W-24" /LENGTH=366 /DNA_ID=CAMNT_0052066709 /DNA_START=2842 /DNA_END=3942 /DNA_ORIENTATION=-